MSPGLQQEVTFAVVLQGKRFVSRMLDPVQQLSLVTVPNWVKTVMRLKAILKTRGLAKRR